MKVLNIDYDRYEYPQGITDIHSLIAVINQNEQPFFEMKQFGEDACVFPYLVKEDMKTVFLNFSNMNVIFEEEAQVLNREDYDEKLAIRIQLKCQDCENYNEENCLANDMKDIKDNLCLDCTCSWYSKMEDEED